METVLERLQKANFRAILKKWYFGESRIDYIGYEITRDGTLCGGCTRNAL
jgi:hypothetical protein